MSGTRQPRPRVLANGVVVPGVIDAEVVNTNHFGADRFRVRVAADAAGVVLVDTAAIGLEVQVSVDAAADFVSLIQGAVDHVGLDPIAGVITLSGRDRVAALIEARTREVFANHTASEIVTILAGRHGLQADVQVTTTPVGRYWELEHDRIVLNQFGHATTEWDLLVTLARHEQFDVWVGGNVLHFRPSVAVAAPAAVLRPRATGTGPANVTALRLERSLILADDITVTVRSWNSRAGGAVAQTARKGAGGAGRDYVYVVPNLAPDDATALAGARLAELVRHERVITAEMPGDLALMPRGMVRVEGTLTDFDQTYWIEAVERSLSMARGFTQSVRARNGSV